MDNEMTVGQRLGLIAQQKKMQKKDLSVAIGVPYTTMSSWINRGGDFPASCVIPLAKALGVTPMYLLTGQEEYTKLIPDDYERLSENERYLLDTIRNLDKDGVVVVMNKAVEELRRCRAEQGSEASSGGSSL